MGTEDEGADRREQLELYRLAVEEYRFQVTLNWQRTQYLLAFNLGAAGLGVGLLSVRVRAALLLTGCVFIVAGVASILTILAFKTQHGYYRAARDKFRKQEELLALQPELQVQTTPGMKGPTDRVVSVQQAVYVIVGLVGAVDLLGAIWTLGQFAGVIAR